MKDLFLSIIRKNKFVILLIVTLILLNAILVKWDPVNRYGFFYQNDFSKSMHLHTDHTLDSVFFGSSIITGAYREDLSNLDLANFGLDYGKVTDLEKILKKNYFKDTKTIVLGLNYMTLMDDLPTNPYYQWHREWYVPYVYFYRTPIRWFFENSIAQIKKKESIFKLPPDTYGKEIYHGNKSEEELAQKKISFEQRFGKEKVENFSENLKSLERVIIFCKENNINLKCLWMPVNPEYDLPVYAIQVKDKADVILRKYDIETVDWTRKFSKECFCDLVHMSWENGAPQFTRELEKWLKR